MLCISQVRPWVRALMALIPEMVEAFGWNGVGQFGCSISPGPGSLYVWAGIIGG